MSAYVLPVSIRKLFAILLALAVLFAPGAAGAALAAAPHHDMQMMKAGHCQTPPSMPAGHEKMAGKSCCIAMCMALAVAPFAHAEARMPRQQVAGVTAPRAYHSLPSEIATPPPRIS
jgi:hypothetical protein